VDWPLITLAFAYGLYVSALLRLLLRQLQALRAGARLPAGTPPFVFRCLWWPLIALAHCVAPLLSAPWRVRVVERLRRADLETSLEPSVWAALQCLLALSGLAMALAVGVWEWLALGPVLALLPEGWLALRIGARRQRLLREWPHGLELLALALGLGCGFRSALTLVVAHLSPGPLRSCWQQVLEDLRAGRSRHDALLRLERRVMQTAISRSLAALNQSEARSAALAAALQRLTRPNPAHRRAPGKGPAGRWWLAPVALCATPCLGLLALLSLVHR